MPLPLNDVLEKMVIQLALLVAVQGHVEDVLTLTLPVLAVDPTDAVLVFNEYEQEVLAVTVALAGAPVPAELFPVTV